MKAGILGICAILLCHTVAEARYISKFVTQDDTREHGGDGDVFLLGSSVVWQGEDASGDAQVYYYTGSGAYIEITQADGSSFSKAYIDDAAGHYVTLRGYNGTWGRYLYDLHSGLISEPAYEGSYSQNATLSGSNVFYSAYDDVAEKHNFYKYDIALNTHELIGIEGADYVISADYGRDHYEGRVLWREELADGGKNYYYYDGSTTVAVTNGSFMGANLSSNQLVFSDNSEVSIYDLTSESWSFVFVEEDLLLGSIAGWTNSYVTPYGYDSTTVREGYVLPVTLGYGDHTDDQLTAAGITSGTQSGRYKATSGQPSSDKQIYLLEGYTNYVLVSDYRYDDEGVIKFESPWFDELETPITNVTEEAYISYSDPSHFTDGVGYVPERWVAHDLSPSAGDGIIAYHAYMAYARYGTFASVDELMVYDIEEEKHYGLYLDDSDRLGHYGSLQWAACDSSVKNVAFTLVDPWASIYDDVGVAYWVGPDAYLVDVDLSGEDLSDIDFTGGDLTRANLSGADLSGADLSGAILTDVIFSNATYNVDTVMPMSFIPSDHDMISLSPEPIVLHISEIDMDGISYSNSVSNLYVGLEYTQSLTSHWHTAEAQGIIFFSSNNVGSIPLSLSSIEFDQLFFRLVGSTNAIGDSVPYTNEVVQFVATDYIDLDKIDYLSKFRSGMGHDYSDDFESCSSMKHYYSPGVTNWADVQIYAPVDGTILNLEEGWAGTQVMIKSEAHPAYKFILFHVDIDAAITNGASVTAGQPIGNHIGNETMSDIAVRISTVHEGLPKQRLVSYFDVMTDGLFSNYVARGVSERADMIISYADRTNDMLICSGQTFDPDLNVVAPGGGYGSITNKVQLSSP